MFVFPDNIQYSLEVTNQIRLIGMVLFHMSWKSIKQDKRFKRFTVFPLFEIIEVSCLIQWILFQLYKCLNWYNFLVHHLFFWNFKFFICKRWKISLQDRNDVVIKNPVQLSVFTEFLMYIF